MEAAAAPDPPSSRPRSVTIVGGAFLALSSLRFLLDCLGWIVWKLGDAERVVRFFLPTASRGVVPLDWILRHFAVVVACQGAVAALVAVISYNFLRLRPWARPALESLCWIALAVTLAIACAFGLAVTRLPAGPEARGLSASVASLCAVAALFGAATWTIRQPRVRQAFATGARSPFQERGNP
jgi:hypothetical protein